MSMKDIYPTGPKTVQLLFTRDQARALTPEVKKNLLPHIGKVISLVDSKGVGCSYKVVSRDEKNVTFTCELSRIIMLEKDYEAMAHIADQRDSPPKGTSVH
jgi:hypothetical protein